MFVKGFFWGILAGLELVDHDNNIIKIIIVIIIMIIMIINIIINNGFSEVIYFAS